jgi:hypothetical protein
MSKIFKYTLTILLFSFLFSTDTLLPMESEENSTEDVPLRWPPVLSNQPEKKKPFAKVEIFSVPSNTPQPTGTPVGSGGMPDSERARSLHRIWQQLNQSDPYPSETQRRQEERAQAQREKEVAQKKIAESKDMGEFLKLPRELRKSNEGVAKEAKLNRKAGKKFVGTIANKYNSDVRSPTISQASTSKLSSTQKSSTISPQTVSEKHAINIIPSATQLVSSSVVNPVTKTESNSNSRVLEQNTIFQSKPNVTAGQTPTKVSATALPSTSSYSVHSTESNTQLLSAQKAEIKKPTPLVASTKQEPTAKVTTPNSQLLEHHVFSKSETPSPKNVDPTPITPSIIPPQIIVPPTSTQDKQVKNEKLPPLPIFFKKEIDVSNPNPSKPKLNPEQIKKFAAVLNSKQSSSSVPASPPTFAQSATKHAQTFGTHILDQFLANIFSSNDTPSSASSGYLETSFTQEQPVPHSIPLPSTISAAEVETLRYRIDDIGRISQRSHLTENQLRKIKDAYLNNAQVQVIPQLAHAWNRIYQGDFTKAEVALLRKALIQLTIDSKRSASANTIPQGMSSSSSTSSVSNEPIAPPISLSNTLLGEESLPVQNKVQTQDSGKEEETLTALSSVIPKLVQLTPVARDFGEILHMDCAKLEHNFDNGEQQHIQNAINKVFNHSADIHHLGNSQLEKPIALTMGSVAVIATDFNHAHDTLGAFRSIMVTYNLSQFLAGFGKSFMVEQLKSAVENLISVVKIPYYIAKASYMLATDPTSIAEPLYNAAKGLGHLVGSCFKYEGREEFKETFAQYFYAMIDKATKKDAYELGEMLGSGTSHAIDIKRSLVATAQMLKLAKVHNVLPEVKNKIKKAFKKETSSGPLKAELVSGIPKTVRIDHGRPEELPLPKPNDVNLPSDISHINDNVTLNFGDIEKVGGCINKLEESDGLIKTQGTLAKLLKIPEAKVAGKLKDGRLIVSLPDTHNEIGKGFEKFHKNPTDLWSKIQSDAELWPHSKIPKYFTMDVEGTKIWVSPNGSKHIAEMIIPKKLWDLPADPLRSIASIPAREYDLIHLAILSDLHDAIKAALKTGGEIIYKQPLLVGNWYLEFGYPAIPNGFPVLIHALNNT